ncbi:unnamed protein product [Arabidopsis halleri]
MIPVEDAGVMEEPSHGSTTWGLRLWSAAEVSFLLTKYDVWLVSMSFTMVTAPKLEEILLRVWLVVGIVLIPDSFTPVEVLRDVVVAAKELVCKRDIW